MSTNKRKKLLTSNPIPEPLRVDGSHRKWGKEAFLDAGEATLGSRDFLGERTFEVN